MRRGPFTRKRGVVAGLLVLSACTSTHLTGPAPTSTKRSPTVRADQGGLLDGCPGPQDVLALPVLARDVRSPDDLLALADGTVWVSDPVHGTLRHLGSNGRVLQTIVDPDAPEGIAQLPDGRLVVAEQRVNRIVALSPPSPRRTTVVELPSAGAALGVDGIAYDAVRHRLLIPDSPHGTLVAWQPSARPTVIARGLGRAVGVAVLQDGAVWVTAEAGRGLLKIDAGEGAQLGDYSQADDVVTRNGLLYVTLIDAGQVVAVDPMTGGGRTLVTGIKAAQGLTVLPDGRLAIADSTRGVIALTPGCA